MGGLSPAHTAYPFADDCAARPGCAACRGPGWRGADSRRQFRCSLPGFPGRGARDHFQSTHEGVGTARPCLLRGAAADGRARSAFISCLEHLHSSECRQVGLLAAGVPRTTSKTECWALAACLQVDACAESFAFQETIMGASREEAGASGAANSDPPAELFDYVTNMEDLAIDADGCVPLLWRPGLGIVIDEGRVREAAKNFS